MHKDVHVLKLSQADLFCRQRYVHN